MDDTGIRFGAAGLSRDEDGYLVNPLGAVFGYARVSTTHQDLARQENLLENYGVKHSHIFMEKVSGKTLNRPMYKKLVHVIQKGDIVVITSIDRLGRDYNDILEQWRLITQDIGCGIHVVDMPALNTNGNPYDLISKFLTDVMLQVLAFVAQNERENTLKRQKQGMEAIAKKTGKRIFGRPRAKIPYEFFDVYVMWKTGEVPVKALKQYAKDAYNINDRTFYRRLDELDKRFADIPPDQLRDYIFDDVIEEEGFEYSAERCMKALGLHNGYTHNPKYEKTHVVVKEDGTVATGDEAVRLEEEELKRIIQGKRQAEFRKRFGLPETIPSEVKRGKRPRVQLSQKLLDEVNNTSMDLKKTVIID